MPADAIHLTSMLSVRTHLELLIGLLAARRLPYPVSRELAAPCRLAQVHEHELELQLQQLRLLAADAFRRPVALVARQQLPVAAGARPSVLAELALKSARALPFAQGQASARALQPVPASLAAAALHQSLAETSEAQMRRSSPVLQLAWRLAWRLALAAVLQRLAGPEP